MNSLIPGAQPLQNGADRAPSGNTAEEAETIEHTGEEFCSNLLVLLGVRTLPWPSAIINTPLRSRLEGSAS